MEEIVATCQGYIGSEFVETFRKQCSEVLGVTDAWGLEVSNLDANVVAFRYPAASTKKLDYVTPQVVLELGTHAEFGPHDRLCTPFASM